MCSLLITKKSSNTIFEILFFIPAFLIINMRLIVKVLFFIYGDRREYLLPNSVFILAKCYNYGNVFTKFEL